MAVVGNFYGSETPPWKLLKAVTRDGSTEPGGSPQAGDHWCLYQKEDVVLGMLCPAALAAVSIPREEQPLERKCHLVYLVYLTYVHAHATALLQDHAATSPGEAMPQASTFYAFSMVGHFHSCLHGVVVHQLAVVNHDSGDNKCLFIWAAIGWEIILAPFSWIDELAEPKPVFCDSSPTLVWGNQETIWTLSGGALTARPSARTLYLAQPKKDFSKYWHRQVIGGRTLLTKYGYPSERLLRLAEPKKFLPAFLAKRSRESPEWPVSLAAQNYNASKRILELARPKGVHPDFMPPREVPTQVSSFAISANASARVQKLAEPLVKELPCCSTHNKPGSVISMVSSSSQKAVASPRTIELAKPKQLHSKFKPPRDPAWPVTAGAKHAVATPRLVELAQPTARPRMGLTALNPDAFKVKEAALKAICSQRLHDLARPVRR